MNRNVRTAVVVGIALLMAGIASFGVYRLLSVRPDVAAMRTVDTVVAARALRLGEQIAAGDVKVVKWPADSALPGTFTSVSDVVDRGVIAPLVENEPITAARIASREAGAGLPPSIPAGMRAVSVKVNEVVGVAGFATPGTRVDVLVTLTARMDRETVTRVVVNNAEVLAAGTRQDQAPRDSDQPPPTVVTLLVSPADAERIAHAASEGRVMLSLRNPLDAAPSRTDGVRTSAMFGESPEPPPVVRPVPAQPIPVAPRPVAAPAPPPAAPAPKLQMVEAIRGAKRSQEVIR